MSSTGETKPPDPRDVPLRGVMWFVGIFIVFGILTHVGLWILYRSLVARDAKMDLQNSALVSERPVLPGPQLQPSVTHNKFPRQDLMELRRAEDDEFAKRGWRSETGEIQIPESIVDQVSALSATQPAGGSRR